MKGFTNINKDKALKLCFYLFVAVLPFTLILTPIALGLLIFVYLMIGNKTKILTRLHNNKAALLVSLLYVIYVIGLFLNVKSSIDFSKIEVQVLMFLVPIVFILLDLQSKHIEKLKNIYVISCIVFCLLAFVTLGYNLIINYEHRLNYNFIQRSMYHFHYPYDVLCINIAYIVLLFGSIFKKIKPLFSFLFFAFILLSGVRIGLFTFAITSTVFAILNIKKLLNFKTVVITITFLVLGIVLIKNSRYVNDKFFDSLNKIGFKTEKQISEIGEQYHKITLREKLWKSSMKVFKESPNFVLGFGPKGSREALNKVYKNEGYKKLAGTNSHNQYLTTLLNNGVLGIIVLVLIFLIALRSSIQSKSIQNVLITIIIAVAFMTESMLERQKGVAIFAIFITLIIIEAKLRPEKSKGIDEFS